MKKTYKIIICIAILIYGVVWVYFSLPERGLGKYIYVDAAEILHTDRKCSCIRKFKTGAAPISRYKTNSITYEPWQHVCSECVSDECYDKIVKQIGDNIAAEERAKVFLYKLYDKLIEVGENQWYSFDSFYSYVMKENNFRRLMAQLEARGYDITEWIEEDFKEEYGIVSSDSIMQNLD